MEVIFAQAGKDLWTSTPLNPSAIAEQDGHHAV